MDYGTSLVWLTPNTEVIKSQVPQDHCGFCRMVMDDYGGHLETGDHMYILTSTFTDFLLLYYYIFWCFIVSQDVDASHAL